MDLRDAKSRFSHLQNRENSKGWQKEIVLLSLSHFSFFESFGAASPLGNFFFRPPNELKVLKTLYKRNI